MQQRASPLASCGELALSRVRNPSRARGSPSYTSDAHVVHKKLFSFQRSSSALSALMVQSSDLEPGPVGNVSHLSFLRVVLVTCG